MPIISSLQLHQINKLGRFFEDSSSTCHICSQDMPNPYKLACGHKYHYDCLLTFFKHNKNCPTCLRFIGFLPLIEGQEPIKGIHREFVSKTSTVKCTGLTAKQNPCNRYAMVDSEYCKLHHKIEFYCPNNLK